MGVTPMFVSFGGCLRAWHMFYIWYYFRTEWAIHISHFCVKTTGVDTFPVWVNFCTKKTKLLLKFYFDVFAVCFENIIIIYFSNLCIMKKYLFISRRKILFYSHILFWISICFFCGLYFEKLKCSRTSKSSAKWTSLYVYLYSEI